MFFFVSITTTPIIQYYIGKLVEKYQKHHFITKHRLFYYNGKYTS